MKLINADYLTGRIFTEADLTNEHTCYESIMAIIESMESDDVLDKIRAEICEVAWDSNYGEEIAKDMVVDLTDALTIIDKYREPTEAESEVQDGDNN